MINWNKNYPEEVADFKPYWNNPHASCSDECLMKMLDGSITIGRYFLDYKEWLDRDYDAYTNLDVEGWIYLKNL